MYLVDSDYVRLVAHGSGRFMHTSATRCAENLHLTEKKKEKRNVTKAPLFINWREDKKCEEKKYE